MKWKNSFIVGITMLGSCDEKPTPPPKIQILERYAVTARVISTHSYSDYWAPLDAIFAWGSLLDPAKTKDVTFSQSDRHYYWMTPPGSKEDIAGQTANTHLIPDSEKTRQEIRKIKPGKTYFFDGALVAVTLNGRTMTSSLSRTDTGDGACEVFLIKSIKEIR